MNSYLVLAAGLLLMVGLVHSILGEILIFNKLRQRSIVPTLNAPPLQNRNIRILWASWHLASILGFAAAAVLFQAAKQSTPDGFVINSLAVAMLLSGLLVLYATKAKHPGWFALTAVATLCWLA